MANFSSNDHFNLQKVVLNDKLKKYKLNKLIKKYNI